MAPYMKVAPEKGTGETKGEKPMKLREQLMQRTASTFCAYPPIWKWGIVALIAGQHGFALNGMA